MRMKSTATVTYHYISDQIWSLSKDIKRGVIENGVGLFIFMKIRYTLQNDILVTVFHVMYLENTLLIWCLLPGFNKLTWALNITMVHMRVPACF